MELAQVLGSGGADASVPMDDRLARPAAVQAHGDDAGRLFSLPLPHHSQLHQVVPEESQPGTSHRRHQEDHDRVFQGEGIFPGEGKGASECGEELIRDIHRLFTELVFFFPIRYFFPPSFMMTPRWISSCLIGGRRH